MASRALMARLSTASSSWVESTSAHHRPCLSMVSIWMLPPIVLCKGRASRRWSSLRSSETRLEPLTAREGQQLIGKLRAAFRRRPHIADPLGQPAVDARGRKSPFNEADVAQHHGEKIVEVMGDPRRELADGLQSLHLPQCRFDALAFLDLPEQLAIGRRQFRGPFVDPRPPDPR